MTKCMTSSVFQLSALVYLLQVILFRLDTSETMDGTQLNQEEPAPSQLYQVPTEDGSPVWQRTFK